MTARVMLVVVVMLVLGGTAAAASRQLSDNRERLKCANLIYAVSKTSVCFSDKFLATIERETNCDPERQFTAIKVSTEKIYQFPFAVMTGEGRFTLTAQERLALKSYLSRGGFLLASAGCSSKEWDRSFRKEIHSIFPERKMTKIPMKHPLFHTVFDINNIRLKKGGSAALEGLEIDGKIVMVYSPEGLNDTANANKSGGKNCCCCGGNEVKNSQQINVNIFTYALTH